MRNPINIIPLATIEFGINEVPKKILLGVWLTETIPLSPPISEKEA